MAIRRVLTFTMSLPAISSSTGGSIHLFSKYFRFAQIWSDLHVNEEEFVCVEIVAHDEERNFNSVIFLGSVNYSSLNKVYSSKVR